ncbi:hypothetical protein JTB14_027582 [Gonioctena quinquepunctata]|nr:hypothetical protein JTB14_027582 [Gonioctena quinquepunctata]
MKPFAGLQEKGSKERVFNYRLSRARRVVEKVFGIMSSVFRVLRKPQLLQPEKVSKTTLACVHIHNFLRKRLSSRHLYPPPGTFDSEDIDTVQIIAGLWRSDQSNMSSLLPSKRIPRKSPTTAQDIRCEYSEFFSSKGRVSWRDEY